MAIVQTLLAIPLPVGRVSRNAVEPENGHGAVSPWPASRCSLRHRGANVATNRPIPFPFSGTLRRFVSFSERCFAVQSQLDEHASLNPKQ